MRAELKQVGRRSTRAGVDGLLKKLAHSLTQNVPDPMQSFVHIVTDTAPELSHPEPAFPHGPTMAGFALPSFVMRIFRRA